MDPWTKILAGPRWTNVHGRAVHSPEMASGRLWAQFLAVGAPRAWGNRGDPHHGVGGCQGGVVWPGDSGPRWRP
jgi:hypothetical protein